MLASEDPLDFEALYRQHRDSIFQLALRLLRDRDRAMDATQETFSRAFEAKDGFRGDAKPSTWLFRIAYNACLARLAQENGHGGPAEGAEPEDASASRPEAVAEREDNRAAVRRALERLGEEDRRLLCLQMDEDLDYQDLAAVLGCSVEAVRMRVSRARRRLKEVLMPVMGQKR